MQQITVRLDEDVIASLEEEAEDAGVSRSEYIRELIDSRHEADELRREVDDLRREVERLENEMRVLIRDREEKQELVEYVEEERSLQQRREDRRDAPVWRRAKWWVFGGPRERERDEEA